MRAGSFHFSFLMLCFDLISYSNNHIDSKPLKTARWGEFEGVGYARTKRRFSSKQTKSKTGDLDARALTCKSTMSEANVIFEINQWLMCYIS